MLNIQRNQTIVDYTDLPPLLDEITDSFMVATETTRDCFRRMNKYYAYVVLNSDEEDRAVLNLFLTVNNIDIDNAWIQFW